MNPWGVAASPPTEAEFFNAARPTAFLLVEGAADERFWAARVDFRACQIRPMGGRDKALATLQTVRSEGKSAFVAVLDADFDRLEGTLLFDADVIWTDCHDLEMTLLASPALDKLLVEVASRKKWQDFEAAEGMAVRDALLARGALMGRLRWLSRRDRLALSFRKTDKKEGTFRHVDHRRFCDDKTWALDVAKLVKTVLDFSSDPRTRPGDLVSRMESLPDADPWQLCVGHDLVGLLAVGLRSKLGSRNLDIEAIEERLRLAFERTHLEGTEMFAALRGWEGDNAPYRLFTTQNV